MDSALIISSSPGGTDFFTSFLGENGCSNVYTAESGGQARRLLIEREYDLCLVNAPLRDESGVNLARSIMMDGVSQVILVVKADYYDEICDKVEDVGVFTLSKPINKNLFWNLLRLCTAAHNKMKRMRQENTVLVQKIEDIRIVDRAKCILIEQLGLTENEAHRHIEKQAMDLRKSRRSVAEDILRTYES